MTRKRKIQLVLILLAYLLVLGVSYWVRFSGDQNCSEISVTNDSGEVNLFLDEAIYYSGELVYSENRKEQNPILIFIHGSPLIEGSFEAVVPFLEGREYFIPDLIGFGDSTSDTNDYSMRAQAEFLKQLVNEHFSGREVDLVAYSWGGGVALELSQLIPNKIRSISFISSIGAIEYEWFGSHSLNQLLFNAQLGLIKFLTYATPHFGLFDNWPLDIEYARSFSDSDQRLFRDYLREWDGPALFLHGRSDALVSVEILEAHQRLVPQAEISVWDGGHGLIYQKPEKVGRELERFLKLVDDGKAKARRDLPSELQALAWDSRGLEREPVKGVALAFLVCIVILATFVSEDLACIGAGLLAAQNLVSLPVAIGAGYAGIFIGDGLLYLAGFTLGNRVVRLPPFSWMVSEQSLQRAENLVKERGALLIFMTRFLPGTRAITYLGAGVLRAPIWSFFLLFGLAGMIWTPLIVGIAYWVGQPLLELFEVLDLVALPLFLFGLLVLYFAFHYGTALFSWRERRLLKGKWIRFCRWEYWPSWQLYFPVVIYLLMWCLVRFRNPLSFKWTNPAMPYSGFVGESKADILRGLEASGAVSPWIEVDPAEGIELALEAIQGFQAKVTPAFPIVLKPITGQRGAGVRIVRSEAQLRKVLAEANQRMIVQCYIDGIEVGVFYARFPDDEYGTIISMTNKSQVEIMGDGRRTLEELILAHSRAVAQAPLFLERFADRLDEVLANGEKMALGELGTHALGSYFLDAKDWWTPALEKRVDQIAKSYEGFYFGRFDLKAPSVEALRKGESLSVLELNGITSESTHLYDPQYSACYAWRTLIRQWVMAMEIGWQNRPR